MLECGRHRRGSMHRARQESAELFREERDLDHASSSTLPPAAAVLMVSVRSVAKRKR